ncbi:MAG: antitoxin VbhA family protein [Clostridiales bacterium]|nr:antitoxin VbhA family protein [Clostridiales bacterium]
MRVSVEEAIRNAEASLRMEGMQPSAEVLHECRQVLVGEVSHEQYIENLRKRFMEAENGDVQP